MPSYNKVIFAGHLTRDPALKFLQSNTAVCDFGMAANRKFKVNDEQREEVCFVDCTIFGKGAEVINQYCKKGKALLVEGRLTYQTWEDKQSGAKRSKHVITVENFQFLGGSNDSADQGDAPSRVPSRRPQSHSKKVADAVGNESHFAEADIHF